MSYIKLASSVENPSIYSGVVQTKEAPTGFAKSVKKATSTPPIHQIFKDQYLQAPPRNNPWDTPYQVQVNKGENELNKKEHENCLVGFNPSQNVPSIYCAENNANWVRGNQFATLPLGGEKLVYLNTPGVKEETNPTFIEDRMFYQFPAVNNYYPEKKTQLDGKSYFVYPYSPQIIVNKYGKEGNISKNFIKEGFNGECNKNKKLIINLIFVIIIFCIIFSVIKYPN